MDPFEILEVPMNATPDDVRAAYHRLAKQWHPDRFTGEEKATAEKKFRQVAEAFNQLKDPLKRQGLAASAPKAGGSTGPLLLPQKASAGRKPEDWADDARKAFEEGDLDRAKGLLQYAIRLDGSKAEFHAQLAGVFDALGDPRGAIRALEEALKLRPKDPEILIALADHFGVQGMQARSSRLLEEARMIAPGHKRFKAASGGKIRPGSAPAGGEEGFLEQAKGMLNKWLKKG